MRLDPTLEESVHALILVVFVLSVEGVEIVIVREIPRRAPKGVKQLAVNAAPAVIFLFPFVPSLGPIRHLDDIAHAFGAASGVGG